MRHWNCPSAGRYGISLGPPRSVTNAVTGHNATTVYESVCECVCLCVHVYVHVGGGVFVHTVVGCWCVLWWRVSFFRIVVVFVCVCTCVCFRECVYVFVCV